MIAAPVMLEIKSIIEGLGPRGTSAEVERAMDALVECGTVKDWALFPGRLIVTTPSNRTFSVDVTIA